MSTIPFTSIEGHLALPRLRPLSHVPAPFGRDWALLPPGYSLRAELKALYAALLRTFCMSDQAIRSLCRWSPLEEKPHMSAAAAAVAQPTFFEPPRGVAAPVAAEAAAIQTGTRPANRWTVLAGGACAVSGVAVLAWIGVDHLTQRHPTTYANFDGAASTHRDSQSASLRQPVTAPVIAEGAAGASAAVAASAPIHSVAVPAQVADASPATALPSTRTSIEPALAAESSPATASTSNRSSIEQALTAASSPAGASASTMAPAPAHVLAGQAIAPRSKHVVENTASRRNQKQQYNSRVAATKQTAHIVAKTANISPTTVPESVANVKPRPSAAGPFSPFAPARLGVDEYAGVALSASTHLRDVERAPRSAASNNPSAASNTEWMNHMSQRRVTEVPDQFVK
jgi:hypothetical protein